jgi:hypoxanthine phosphoribosyltransferase
LLLNHLRQQGPASLEIATFLRKPSRTVVDVKPRFVGQVIDDLFVVGYGMDHAQTNRGLSYVGVKP